MAPTHQSAEALVEKPKPSSSSTSYNPEEEMWELVKSSNNIDDIQEFLNTFPDGKLFAVASLKLTQLKRKLAKKKSVSKSQSDKASGHSGNAQVHKPTKRKSVDNSQPSKAPVHSDDTSPSENGSFDMPQDDMDEDLLGW